VSGIGQYEVPNLIKSALGAVDSLRTLDLLQTLTHDLA